MNKLFPKKKDGKPDMRYRINTIDKMYLQIIKGKIVKKFLDFNV